MFPAAFVNELLPSIRSLHYGAISSLCRAAKSTKRRKKEQQKRKTQKRMRTNATNNSHPGLLSLAIPPWVGEMLFCLNKRTSSSVDHISRLYQQLFISCYCSFCCLCTARLCCQCALCHCSICHVVMLFWANKR